MMYCMLLYLKRKVWNSVWRIIRHVGKCSLVFFSLGRNPNTPHEESVVVVASWCEKAFLLQRLRIRSQVAPRYTVTLEENLLVLKISLNLIDFIAH